MANTRLKGRDCTIRITDDGVIQTEITAVVDWTLNLMIESIQEGYQGETADRFDTDFKGVNGTINGKLESIQALQLAEALGLKAEGRLPATRQLNLTLIKRFPNGQSARIRIPDWELNGDFAISSPGKNQYVSFTIPYVASEFRLSVTQN